MDDWYHSGLLRISSIRLQMNCGVPLHSRHWYLLSRSSEIEACEPCRLLVPHMQTQQIWEVLVDDWLCNMAGGIHKYKVSMRGLCETTHILRLHAKGVGGPTSPNGLSDSWPAHGWLVCVTYWCNHPALISEVIDIVINETYSPEISQQAMHWKQPVQRDLRRCCDHRSGTSRHQKTSSQPLCTIQTYMR